MLPDAWVRFTAAVVEALEACHADHPDLPGLGQERLRLTMPPRLPAILFSAVLRRLSAEGHATLDRSWVRRPWHVVRFSNEEERIWARIVPMLRGTERFRPPRLREVATAQGLDEGFVRRLFKMAARRGDVEEIAKDHFFMSETVVEMADIACELAAKGEDGHLTVIDFRDRVDNGRKVAVQILEYFDRQGLTMRRGDIRRINPHGRTLFSRSTLR
jgi:selenocysteine-specific elongation factor